MAFLAQLKNRFMGSALRHAPGSRWKAVSDLWGARAAELAGGSQPSSWTENLLVCQHYINPLISGSGTTGWLEKVARDYFTTPVDRALSLGCGGGGLERHALAMKMAARFDAFDISDSALQLARDLAIKEGHGNLIKYQVADLNTLALPTDHYDAVFASQSVHHIESLEHYLDQVWNTLKDGQLFIVNEFLGPNQFQWTDAQMEHSQNLLDRLPETYKSRIRGSGLKTIIEKPTIETMNRVDPTEAIRSRDILPEIEKRFEIIDKRDFGGTLLHLVLDDIAGNFKDTPEDRRWLQMLFDEEQALLRSGEITSDFALIVARKQKQVAN